MPPDPPGSARPRVLFVEDDPRILAGLRLALHGEPFDVLAAGSAHEALDMLAKTPVDVVVSDDRTPGMRGAELLGVVAARHPETIRLVLTGEATLDAAVRAINEGEVYRFLPQPCPAGLLARTIRDALAVKALRAGTARLLAEAKRRGRVLSELERRHPGITRVSRGDSGEIAFDAGGAPDLETLIREIRSELDRDEAA